MTRYKKLHPLCELHRQGLYEIPALRISDQTDPLRVTAEVARHPELFKIIAGFYAGGADASTAAARIEDDSLRVGAFKLPGEHRLTRIVRAVYVTLDKQNRGVR